MIVASVAALQSNATTASIWTHNTERLIAWILEKCAGQLLKFAYRERWKTEVSGKESINEGCMYGIGRLDSQTGKTYQILFFHHSCCVDNGQGETEESLSGAGAKIERSITLKYEYF